MNDDKTMKVLVRSRPTRLNNQETFTIDDDCVKINNRTYTFDKVLDGESTNDDLTNVIMHRLKQSIGRYNTTLFAYGASGSGKTYNCKLIIKSIINALPKDLSFSFYEIYNEKAYDLISQSLIPLKVRESIDIGFYLEGLTCQQTSTHEDFMKYYTWLSKNRKCCKTALNPNSSRSHSILIIYYNGVKMTLVDLAGSEKTSKSGVTGSTLVETNNINKSLLSFSRVIEMLVNDPKSHSIPFRETLVTKLLSQSLIGNAMTTFLVCINQSTDASVTENTLKFANNIKKLKTKPKEILLKKPVLTRHRAIDIDIKPIVVYRNVDLDAIQNINESVKLNLLRLLKPKH